MKLIDKLHSISADKLKLIIQKYHEKLKNEIEVEMKKMKDLYIMQQSDMYEYINYLSKFQQKFEVSQNDSEEYKQVFIEYIEIKEKYDALYILVLHNIFISKKQDNNSLNVNEFVDSSFKSLDETKKENLKGVLNNINELYYEEQVPMRIKLKNGSFAEIKGRIYTNENGEEKNINLVVDYHRIEYDYSGIMESSEPQVKKWGEFLTTENLKLDYKQELQEMGISL